MKADKNKDSFIIEAELPPELINYSQHYPENRRRPVNKILFKNDYFHLTYHTKQNCMSVSSRGDIVYSAIPYDTCRKYIQRAAIQYLVYPESVHRFIELHKATLETYLTASIAQVTQKKVTKDAPEVHEAYQAILANPLFEIQVLGRLLQHNETGPLSANLPGKFLFHENLKTGISEYISEYLTFVVQLTHFLPLKTDGRNIQLLETKQPGVLVNKNTTNSLTFESDLKPALQLLPQEVKQNIENAITIGKNPVRKKPLLRSKFGKELSEVRKHYIAHSIPPEQLEPYFKNALPTENTNLINVISDIHMIDGTIPFNNKNFNILAGDISDSYARSKDIKGIYVIGNHELVSVLPDIQDKNKIPWKPWRQFFNAEWFKMLLQDPDEAWYMLPVGDHKYYKMVTNELEERFPKMHVLNNRSIVHNGVRYIGLTIPVVLARRKKEQQQFILRTLEALLNRDYNIPTVIVSHAPLFNELSMVSPKSKAYNRDYTCSEANIIKLFKEYHIIGAIHGHHHIPASSGQYKITEFAGKELFVVCSIYSKVNTGFDLVRLINNSLLDN